MRHYLGIDPGEVWVGYAKLAVDNGVYTANMGVINIGAMSFVPTVGFLVPIVQTHTIVESYQQRPVGYQRFASGHTLQLIGALKYAMLLAGHEWSEVPPKDPSPTELNKLLIGRYLTRWQEFLECPGDPRWRHAHSAWRVLAQYLLMRGSNDLSDLKRKVLPPLRPCGPIRHGRVNRVELIAPTVTWELKN
jgi:hypothetical protein